MSQTFFLDPLDVLLFRDGRPQVTGDSHVGHGLFPPPPTTLYGAFRSAVMAHAGAQFTAYHEGHQPAHEAFASLAPQPAVVAAVGTPESPGTLALEQTLLAYRDGTRVAALFPAGLDLARPKTGGGASLLLTPRTVPAALRTSLPPGLAPLGAPDDTSAFLEAMRGFLDADAFTRYLCGEAPATLHHPTGSWQDGAEQAGEADRPLIYGEEVRTSVSLDDKTGTAAEGMLFSTRYTRLRPGYGLLATIAHAPGLPEKGLLRVGGEQRPVAYQPATPALPDASAVQQRVQEGRLRLILTTPAPFARGWKPDFLGDDLKGTLHGVPVRLVAAAVGRYGIVAGWDMATNRPRPARRAAPAGSVYFLQTDDPARAADLVSAGWGRSLFPLHTDEHKLGLGLAYLGTW